MHKGTQQRAECLVIIQGGCSTCPLKDPINALALSLGPKLSLFSEVSYCRIALTSQLLTRFVTNKGLTLLLQPAILKKGSGFSYEIF